MRLIKASLTRTFPKLDSAVSLSAAQIAYLNDVSASVQAQLNTLRDGSATANAALYANSASYAIRATSASSAEALGGFSAGVYVRRNITASFSVPVQITSSTRALDLHTSASVGWIPICIRDISATEVWWVVFNPATGNLNFDLQSGTGELRYGGSKIAVDGHTHSAGAITSGTLNASHAASASFATLAALATNATDANSASSAALLAGLAPDTGDTANTIVRRNGSADVFVRYVNSSAVVETSASVAYVFTRVAADAYMRPVPANQVGRYMEARNISGRTGTSKTLQSGSGPPSLTGSTNGDLFFYY